MKILAELRGVRELPKAAPVHASVGAGKSGFNRRIHALSFQFPVTSFQLSSFRSHRCSVQFHWKLEAGNWQLSMTRRTAGELRRVRDLVFLHQPCAEARIVGRRFPRHVIDLLARPYVLLGMSVAIQAP